ncbi:MAG: rhomboid family intramembrane serine protease [bacterium]|nr:rhomboid family intramembrane serine protease [Gammaproteobacteria bacterium]HIL98751.1 rhomboid family intramembrane serine protease [Pseudomonadales bacterium]
MIVAVKIPRDIDLSLFTRFLHQSGVWHRIAESGDMQVIRVESEEDKVRVISLYGQFSSGAFSLKEGRSKPEASRNPLIGQLLGSPLTLTLILVNIICFPITRGVDDGNLSSWFYIFSFLNFEVIGGQAYFADLNYTFSSHQYWRLFTPMLLHFGWLHIVFNLLWVWEIGRRIERVCGASILLLVTLVSSLCANMLQYWMLGASFFGGMSGVVYGLLGFSLVWSGMVRSRNLGVRKAIYVAMLGFLVIGFTGAFDLLGLGDLANGAHLGGLLAGLLVGGLAGALENLKVTQT